MDFNFEQVRGFHGTRTVLGGIPITPPEDAHQLPYFIPNEKDRTYAYDFVAKIHALEERVKQLEEKLNAKQ